MKRPTLIIILLLLVSAFASARGLILPTVPAELRQPAERADYILLHLWDMVDFADCEAMNDEEYMGEHIATFISLFPHASEEGRMRAATSLTEKAAAASRQSGKNCAMTEIKRLLEAYLLNEESGVADDDIYILMADAMLASNFPDYETTRELRNLVARSRPGTKAPDIDLTLRNGEYTTLLTIGAGKEILLLFHNPECDECKQEIARIESDSSLMAKAEKGELILIAVYAESDSSLWQNTTHRLSTPWIDAIATDPDKTEDHYSIPAMPTLYRVDTRGVITSRR